jgi:hypothetical protein
MKLTAVTKLVVLVVGAVIAMSTFVACGKSSESTSSSTPSRGETSSSVVAMPQKATFITEMPTKDGQPPMVLAVSVDGDRVVAYACNNSNDEAWFFGTQNGGSMELTSRYLDKLQAKFDGGTLNATLELNSAKNDIYMSAMQSAPAPAGIYTATAGSARASWIVLPDNKVVGVLSANSKNDREVIDQINAQQAAFKEKVRQARLNRQLQQASALNVDRLTSQLNGTQVTAVQVTGNMTSLPGSG